MNKIIIYSAVPISSIWARNFGFDKFNKNNYQLIFFDTSLIFFSKDQIDSYYSKNEKLYFQWKHQININSFYELEKHVRNLDQHSIIWIINRGVLETKYANTDIEIFNKYNIKYFTGHGFLIPSYNACDNKNLFKSFPEIIKYKLTIKRYQIQNSVLKPDFVIGSGIQGREQSKLKIPKNKTYVSIPSLLVAWEVGNVILPYKYIVYVDEYALFSPDMVLLNTLQSVGSSTDFFNSMNQIFEKCEDLLSVPVIISASDKGLYKNNPFDGRTIIYGKTQELIQHAELIIGHKTSALGQAIIEKKPTLIILDKEFIDIKNKQIKFLAKCFFKQGAIWSHELEKINLDVIKNIDFKYLTKIEHQYYKEPDIDGEYFENLNNYLLSFF